MKRLLSFLLLSIIGFTLSAFIVFNTNFPVSNVQPNTPNYKYIQNELLYADLELFDGSKIKIVDLNKDKVVLLDFWYLSCLPCLRSIPHLINLQEKYKDNLVILGINDVDHSEMITKFFTAKEANYLSTFKTDINFTKNAEIYAAPTLVLINKQGKVLESFNGWNKRKIQKAINSAIKN